VKRELEAASSVLKAAQDLLDKDLELQDLYQLQKEVEAPTSPPAPAATTAPPSQPARDILSEFLQERGRRNRRPILTTCLDCRGRGMDGGYFDSKTPCYKCDGSGKVVKPVVKDRLEPWAERLENALYREFMDWWPTSEASRTRKPETSGTKWEDRPDQPVTHWLNVEDFLNERYPEAATGSVFGGEQAGPLLEKTVRADDLDRNPNIHDPNYKVQPTPEWLEAHGYIGTGNAITQAFLGLHNRYNRRPWRNADDRRRYYELMLRHVGPKAPRPRKVASYLEDLVGRLGQEFDDWANTNGVENPHDVSTSTRWWGKPRGPIGHWPNVESFLKEKYPASHRGLEMGWEDARPALHRKKNTYETGPRAVNKYGYDPKEITAAMLLLHSQTHPGRANTLDRRLNWDRLQDIAQKRWNMERRNEERKRREQEKKKIRVWVNGQEVEQPDPVAEAKVAIRMAQQVLAMPAEDAYDGNWKNRKTSLPVVGPFYHSSDHDLPDGTILLPNQGESKFADDYERRPGWKERTKWVWMELDPSGGWGEHTYEVEPLDEGPWPWNGDGRTHGYTSPRARIIRKMTPEDQQELMDAFIDRMHEENRRLYASRTAMPAPAPKGLRFEVEPKEAKPHPANKGVSRVHAYVGDERIGHIEWLDKENPWSLVTPRKPGEVSFIFVHPNYRRHNVATLMFDWAKKNVAPDLHHSQRRTDLGDKWVGYEQNRELQRAAAVREANTILAKWKVDPNFFGAVHEMGHVMDAVGGFKASDTLDQALIPVYEAETGDKVPDEPGGHWGRYRDWMRENLPGRAWEQRTDMYGRPTGGYNFNAKEAIASAFVEHEINPEASTSAMRALHQHVVDHSVRADRPTNLTTFRPRAKRPKDIGDGPWPTGKLPRGFMDGVQHVFTKYPQSRIVDMVEPKEMSQYGQSPVTQIDFAPSWDSKPTIEYDDRAALYPSLVDDSFQDQFNQGVISPWMWEDDEDDTLAKAAAALRVAMPLVDAYDPDAIWEDDYVPSDQVKKLPTTRGKWYHISPHDLEAGTRLIPKGGDSPFYYDDEKPHSHLPAVRRNWVWFERKPKMLEWMRLMQLAMPNAHVYEVKPEVEGPWPWNGSGQAGHVSPAATIVRKIPTRRNYRGDVEVLWDEARDDALAKAAAVLKFAESLDYAPIKTAKKITFYEDRTGYGRGQPVVYATEEDPDSPWGGTLIGELQWHHPDGDPPPGPKDKVNQIKWIHVAPEYRRRGIGRDMFNWAKKNANPDLEFSDHMTDDGHAWSQSMGHNPKEWRRFASEE
jgi:GNAT superfamily N-acetyltransferase